jgi:isopentenyldiphosphate isomerase
VPELIDIRDENGKPTGEIMARADVHRTESRHGVALVWVYNERGEVLLQLRAAHLNAFPEKWDVTVSGHLSAGEKPLDAALRELREEVGIHAQPDELEALGDVMDEFPLSYGKEHREYDFVFLTKQNVDPTTLRLQAAEVLDVRWVSVDTLEQDLQDDAHHYRYSGRNQEVFQRAIEAVRRRTVATEIAVSGDLGVKK